MGYGQGSAIAAESAAVRTVVLASADTIFRQGMRRLLTEMRWDVREASGGAEAIAQLETNAAEALLVDSWLPDLEVGEFATQMRQRHPAWTSCASMAASRRRAHAVHAATKFSTPSARPRRSPEAPVREASVDRTGAADDRLHALRADRPASPRASLFPPKRSPRRATTIPSHPRFAPAPSRCPASSATACHARARASGPAGRRARPRC